MVTQVLKLLAPALVAMTLTACASSGSVATPPTAEAPAPPPNLAVPPRGNEGLLGSVHVNIDPVAGTATVDPVRMNQAIGDAFLVGLNDIDHLCDCFRVQGVSTEPIPGGLRVSLRTTFDHPFPAAVRPDLNGWDLKAIVATDFNQQPFGTLGSASSGVLVNADGYTEEWSDQIALAQPGLSSTMYPYIILGEDPTVSDPFDFQNPSGWNVFPAGGSNAGTFVFDLPFASSVALDLFFTVGYQASATRATRQTPDYQPPRGNSRSAWKIEAEVLNADLDATIGSTADLEIRIWDWQHGQSLGSDVASITLHAPSLMTNPVIPGLSGGSGRDTDPLTALGTVTNELGTAPAGTAYALIEVVDELHNNNPGGFGGDPGMTKIADDFVTPLPYDAIRTFQVVPLEIEANLPGVDPVPVLVSSPPLVAGALTINMQSPACFDASGSFDPDAPASPEGDLVLYEWDFVWNGVPGAFVADVSGATATSTNFTYTTPQSTNLGLRVTDGVGRRGLLTVPVTVTNRSAALNLDAPVDVVSYLTDPIPDNRPEYGPALIEESDSQVSMTYMGYRAPCASEQTYVQWTGASWTNGSYQFGTCGGGAFFGYYKKAAPNWANGTLLGIQDAVSDPGIVPWNFWIGVWQSPGINIWGFFGQQRYGCDIATSRSLDRAFIFGDDKPSAPAADRQLQCAMIDNVQASLVGGFPPNTMTVIDSRPNEVSHWRSALGTADGHINIAYRSANKDALRFARDTNADNAGWQLVDVATGAAGTYFDPTLDSDESLGMVIVASRFSGGQHQLQLFHSCDRGQTWDAPIAVGAPLASEPQWLGVSSRWVNGALIWAVTYVQGGQFRVRWSANGGNTWTEAPIGPGTSEFSTASMMRRSGGEFFAAYVGTLGGRNNVFTRRGQFTVS